MAEVQYYTDFRFADEVDSDEQERPWRQAVRQIKVLVFFCALSAIVAIAYPQSFAEIFAHP